MQGSKYSRVRQGGQEVGKDKGTCTLKAMTRSSDSDFYPQYSGGEGVANQQSGF